MGQCKWCGKSGWFLSLSPAKLCKKCHTQIFPEVSRKGEVISQSFQLIEKTKSLKTKLTRCDTIIQYASDLVQYEEKGIPTITPSPSEIVTEYSRVKKEALKDDISEKTLKAARKVKILTTSTSKINQVTKVLLLLCEI